MVSGVAAEALAGSHVEEHEREERDGAEEVDDVEHRAVELKGPKRRAAMPVRIAACSRIPVTL